jgi:hypothetical protein
MGIAATGTDPDGPVTANMETAAAEVAVADSRT